VSIVIFPANSGGPSLVPPPPPRKAPEPVPYSRALQKRDRQNAHLSMHSISTLTTAARVTCHRAEKFE